MLKFKTGDILTATENIICHQVNVDGVMGGGLALQIASKYPEVEKKYKEYCRENYCSYDALCGESYRVKINDQQEIANCFTQLPNYDTDYQAIKDCFMTLLMICKETNKTICIPYKYGCGIANGDWKVVRKILEDLSTTFQIDIYVYQFETERPFIELDNVEEEILDNAEKILETDYEITDKRISTNNLICVIRDLVDSLEYTQNKFEEYVKDVDENYIRKREEYDNGE